MTTLTEPRYVLHSGVVGPHPMWWQITYPTTREKAIEAMRYVAAARPADYGPHGTRRLRVVAK